MSLSGSWRSGETRRGGTELERDTSSLDARSATQTPCGWCRGFLTMSCLYCYYCIIGLFSSSAYLWPPLLSLLLIRCIIITVIVIVIVVPAIIRIPAESARKRLDIRSQPAEHEHAAPVAVRKKERTRNRSPARRAVLRDPAGSKVEYFLYIRTYAFEPIPRHTRGD